MIGWAVGAGGRYWYLPTGHSEGNLCPATVQRWAQTELRGKRISNLSTKFDMHMARGEGVDLDANRWHDVGHAEALLNEHEKDLSLEGIAQRRLGEGKIDPGPKDNLAAMPAWDVAAYAKRDVELVERIERVQTPLLSAEDLDRVMQLEDEVLPATCAMEAEGCPIDEALLAEWLATTLDMVEQWSFDLYRQIGFAPNPDSNEHWLRLFKQCGLVNPHKTEKGAASFKAEFLCTVEHPTVQRLFKLGKLIDLRNKFLLPYSHLVHNGRLWPTFHQLGVGEEGTRSGRFSCVRPNVQQVLAKNKHRSAYGDELPFLIRRLFLPAPGRVFYCSDQAQVEYRIGAHYMKLCADGGHFSPVAASSARAMARRYADNPNTDYHGVVGEFVAPYAPQLLENRTDLKIFNFRKMYGSGARSIGRQLKLDESKAYELFNKYDDAFPALKELLKFCSTRAESKGYVTSILGRRSRMRDRWYAALNRVIQPSAADLFKTTLVEVHRHRHEFGFAPRMCVHDELDGDLLDPAEAPRLTAFLNEVLPKVGLKTEIPILWDAGVGANWAEAKD